MKVQDILETQKKSGKNEGKLCTGRDEKVVEMGRPTAQTGQLPVLIGHYKKTVVDDNSWLSVKSKLTCTFDLQAGKGDQDAVTFRYNGQTWDCGGDKSSSSGGSHQCTLKKSGYESGDREGIIGVQYIDHAPLWNESMVWLLSGFFL
ncbi:uncharacterized protein PG986_012751 [Apiospora aurea]|uniref:Uncharacterized protein n=1 Tax=Apiospora aurea TaxID=335848 RepID=A0ABR1Q0W3_9PEZI